MKNTTLLMLCGLVNVYSIVTLSLNGYFFLALLLFFANLTVSRAAKAEIDTIPKRS